MRTLTLKISWGVASSDWANVCYQDKPFSTNVYQRMLLKQGTGAGSGERGTEVWERVVSGNLHFYLNCMMNGFRSLL